MTTRDDASSNSSEIVVGKLDGETSEALRSSGCDALRRSTTRDSIGSTGALKRSSSRQLQAAVNRHKDLHEQEAHGHGHGHHGHGHDRQKSLVRALVSGFVNYILMFGLCCAYGLMMFPDDFNLQHRALGVKLNLSTALISGLLVSWKSKIPVAIGGPDMNAVVFLGGFANTISEGIAEHVGLKEDYSELTKRRLMEDTAFDLFRRLGGGGGGGGIDFCTPGGYHESKHMAACQDYHERLRATVIFATVVSSATLGLILFLLGRFRITRFVSYVPTSVQEAFLSCMGYKVFKYALVFCNYTPLQFIPAALVGVTIYFFKKLHLGDPAIVLPVMILFPLAVFYLIVLIFQLDIDTMRTSGTPDNWMFPKLTHQDFWEISTHYYGNTDQIDFGAWLATLPNLASMIVVCIIACLLDLSSTEAKLGVKADKEYEATLYGLGNILTTATGSSVGYMQLKFGTINSGVLGNAVDRRGGVVYAILCGACFFGTIDHFNFLPRFFLGTLLFLAGSGFVAEHLWGSRKYLSFAEWSEILIILAIFIFSGSLVAAVLAGVLLTCMSLILKYSKISCVAGRPLLGGKVTSCVRCNPLLQRQVSHFANSWFVVIRLKGFVFFAPVAAMTARVSELIKARDKLHGYQHLRYVVLDCDLLDGMDASAGQCIRHLLVSAQKAKVKLLWSNATRAFAEDLLRKEMIATLDHAFPTLEATVLYIEYAIMEYHKDIQRKWLSLSPTFQRQHQLAKIEREEDPWSAIFLKCGTARRGCPWRYCSQVPLEEYTTHLWQPGETEQGLILIHYGKVALFSEIPTDDASDAWSSPAAVYEHGWFLNRESLIGQPTRYHAVAIHNGLAVSWSKTQWRKMFAEHPKMAAEIWRAAAAQQALDAERTEALLEMNSIEVEDNDDDDVPLEVSCPYEEGNRAHLPEQLKVLLDTLEMAEAFGAEGAYGYLSDVSNYTFQPPLPQKIKEDLDVAFNVYKVQVDPTDNELVINEREGPEDHEGVLPVDQAMAALAYAGIPKAVVRCSDQEFLTKDEFARLGHEASMARLSTKLLERLRETLQWECKRQGWVSPLDSHQISDILTGFFHPSLTPELVQGLMDEMGPQDRSDEAVFTSICSRLFRWHEQPWILLESIRLAAGIDTSDLQSSLCQNRFTSEQLTKVLKSSHELPHEQAVEIASEMLWACGWLSVQEIDEHWGECRHIFDVAVCVLTQICPPTGDTVSFNLLFVSEGLGGLQQGPAERQFSFPTSDLGSIGESSHDSEAVPWHLKTFRQQLHLTLEDPGSSRWANYLFLTMGALIMISVFTMILQPLTEHGREDNVSQTEENVWFIFELILTVIFTSEYLMRLSVANALGTQTYCRFVITPANVCDLVAILPFYVELAFDSDAESFRLGRIIRIVRLLRLARIGRLARLARRSEVFAPVAMVLVVIWGVYMQTLSGF